MLFGGQGLLKPGCACESPENLVKMQSPIFELYTSRVKKLKHFVDQHLPFMKPRP